MIRKKNEKGQFTTFEKYDPPVAKHDPRTLDKGGQCYDDNCLYHEQEKSETRFHYILSKIACHAKNCQMTHLGFTGVPIEVPTGTREFNMMIRPVKKATQEVKEEVGRGAYQSPNNPYHPRHFTTNWRECIYRGCLAHEAAR
jgi:hypothetical protein